MSPLSSHFDGSEDSPSSIGMWQWIAGFASLIPFIGMIPACASIVWGIMRIEKTGGKALLVLGILGFGLTGVLTGKYYDQIFPTPSAPAVSTGSSSGTETISWLPPAEGQKESQRTHKPILYDFTAHWCGYCKLMDQAVFEKADDAKQITRLYVPVVVMDEPRETGTNSKDVSDLQVKYQVRGYPTLVVEYPDKNESRVLVGYQGEPAIMAFINQGKP